MQQLFQTQHKELSPLTGSMVEGTAQGTFADRKTVPELGCSSPAINLSIVDFPIPLGPTTTKKKKKKKKRQTK